MQRIAHFLIIIFLFALVDADAQDRSSRSPYESLLRQSEQPAAWSDKIVIPKNDTSATVAVFFRLEYDFIPFLRKRPNMNPEEPEMEYFAPVRMGLEIFEGEHTNSRRATTPSGTPVFRDTWNDTVWVETFEETRSRFDHVQGVLSTDLPQGDYHFQLQLAQGQSEQQRPSQIRNLSIPGSEDMEKADIILADNIDMSGNSMNVNILNYGNNILYGQNFDLLVRLPAANADDENERYQLSIHRMQNGEKADDEARYTTTIGNESIFTSGSASIQHAGDQISVEFSQGENGTRYAHMTIPNAEFENSSYKIELMDTQSDETVGERIIQSRWVDMPVSLYNLDVAIDMLKFIADEQQLRNLNSGSSSERERKFRNFWAERDPTPDTEYNELMAEYYSRIDHAYQNFSSLQTPGYNTDRGKAYILFGPPNDIDRRLQPNQPTREIWEYPDRQLIFEAISGLGEFRLVSES